LSGRRSVGARVPGAGDVGLPAVEVTDELLDRRAAVAELGAELRALADLVTRTEVGAIDPLLIMVSNRITDKRIVK
jgi:hypothetical protein